MKKKFDAGAAVQQADLKPVSKYVSIPRGLLEIARKVGAHMIEDKFYVVVKLRSKETGNTNYPEKIVVGQGFIRFFGNNDEIAVGIHVGKSWFRTSAIKLVIRADNIYIIETINSVYRLETPYEMKIGQDPGSRRGDSD